MGWAARRPRAHSPQEQFETMRYASDVALGLAADSIAQARLFAAALKGTVPEPSAADVDDWLTSSESHEATLAALRASLAALDQFGRRT